jgi:hypothetical protein|tara:strand:+ start:447 stop:788 length:342 start_codon:yes stop_codon:yes gene_type:complete
MANTFKQATKASLVTDAVSSTNTNVLTAGASSTLIILNALVANKTTTSANVDVYLVPNSGDSVYLLKSVPVPAGSSLELITGSKIILESQDVLRARCDTATAMDLTMSYLDQT